MDLTSLTTLSTQVLKVIGPDKKPTDIEIELYSTDTEVYDEALAKFREIIIDKKVEKTTGTEARKLNAEILARCTKAWYNIQWEGTELEYSYENALMLYSNPKLRWLMEQVQAFHSKRENYLGN
jgi:hypothetical protein